MRPLLLTLLALLTVTLAQHPVGTANNWNVEERRVSKFIQDAESQLWKNAQKATVIEWAYESNITDHNEKVKLEYQKISDALSLKLGKQAQKFDADQIHDKELKRKLKKISMIGASALPQDKLDRYNELTNEMAKIYSTAKFPAYKDKSRQVRLEPDLSQILASSRDPKELEYYWTEWRKFTGKKMREMYLEFVDLSNEAARLNGFKDATEMKTASYESDTFVKEMEETWLGLKPLYEQLHAYVRHKLVKIYGEDVVPKDGPIPAHLLGNMWSQSWNNLAKELRPYPNKPDIDVTEEMKRQGWTAKVMFEKVDEFFQSLGLPEMTSDFWKNSIIEKPADGRELTCHASAWDFYVGEDFRIKQCTRVTDEDFRTVNHEMGHTQYQMAYRNQSFLYRTGANPGFHEGVADILSIAVGTASYFKRLNLLDQSVDETEKETNINILFNMALNKLVFMPWGYLVDKYRWDLYSGWANENNMNCHWVKLRLDIQGIAPANRRSEEFFDPGAKYHVAANVGYVRYFTAHIYEFDFFRAMCLAAKAYDPNDPDKPLHRCDFYNSKEAGKLLFSMLKLGSSKPWKEVIEVMTGVAGMRTEAFREYFKPLEKWLQEENERNGVKVGWKVDNYNDYCEGKGNGSGNIQSSLFSVLTIAVLTLLRNY